MEEDISDCYRSSEGFVYGVLTQEQSLHHCTAAHRIKDTETKVRRETSSISLHYNDHTAHSTDVTTKNARGETQGRVI